MNRHFLIARNGKQMTERGTEQTNELADVIVGKFRNLFSLESRVLERREQAANRDTAETDDPQNIPTPEDQERLPALETLLEEQVKEMEEIINELKSTTPSFRTYVLPQMSEIVKTLKTSDAAGQVELVQLVAALIDNGNRQSLEQLEAVIITQLRDNLEKTFGM